MLRRPPAMPARNGRLGLALFGLYLLLYAGFVVLVAFGGDAMEATPVPGINVAVLYGFGLITAAIVLALLYGAAARPSAPEGGG